MKTWLTVIAIKLGIVKLVCAHTSFGSLLKQRMDDLGLLSKDVARGIGCCTCSVLNNVRTGRGRLLNRIEKFLNAVEKQR